MIRTKVMDKILPKVSDIIIAVIVITGAPKFLIH